MTFKNKSDYKGTFVIVLLKQVLFTGNFIEKVVPIDLSHLRSLKNLVVTENTVEVTDGTFQVVPGGLQFYTSADASFSFSIHAVVKVRKVTGELIWQNSSYE